MNLYLIVNSRVNFQQLHAICSERPCLYCIHAVVCLWRFFCCLQTIKFATYSKRTGRKAYTSEYVELLVDTSEFAVNLRRKFHLCQPLLKTVFFNYNKKNWTKLTFSGLFEFPQLIFLKLTVLKSCRLSDFALLDL